MKFKIQIKKVTGEDSWWEYYEKNISDAVDWAEKTIASFNATLRPGEAARELLAIEVLDDIDNVRLHDWDKDIKTMSASIRGRVYDGMRCKRCGITGKRFGLSSHVKIDSKFKKKAFQRCDLAIEELKTGKYT